MPKLTNRLFTEMRRLDGARFLAFLSTTAQAPTKDQVPYRTLVVKSAGILRPGDIVEAAGGRKMLLLETSRDHEWAEAYRAAYVSGSYAWERRGVETDPVSKVKRDTGMQPIGTIYAYFEKPEVIMFEGSKETKYRILTGEDVQPGDTIDGKSVKRVYGAMGVKAVELE